MNIPHAQPSEVSSAGNFARAFARAIGPAYQAPDGSTNAADFLSLGQLLADARDQNLAALAEAFADSATYLLDELENMYGLQVRSDMATADRRTRLVAKIRAGRAGTPQELVRAIQVYDSTVVIHENDAVDVDLTNPRAVFLFAIEVATTTFASAEKLNSIRAIAEQMKPAHTAFSVCTNADFLCDDAASLTDRDVLGA